MPSASASVVKARFGVNGARMSLLAPVMYSSSGLYGSATMSFEPMYMTAYAGQIAPTVTGGNLVIYPLGMWGHGLTGHVGQGDFSFEPVIGLASGHEIPDGGVDPGVYNYGEGALALSPLEMAYAFGGLPTDQVFMVDSVRAESIFAAPSVHNISMTDVLTLLDTLFAPALHKESMLDTVTATATITLPQTYLVTMDSTMSSVTVMTFVNTKSQTYSEQLEIGSSASASRVLPAQYSESMSIQDAVEYVFSRGGALLSSLSATDTLTTEAVKHAVLMQLLKVAASAGSLDPDAVTYVVDRLSGATTRYDNFDFTHFFSLNSRTYGVKKDGVYLLASGKTDNGSIIKSSVDFGSKDFGVPNKKILRHVYVGASGESSLSLRVVDGDGSAYVYSVPNDEILETRRVDLGRGLLASFYKLQLISTDGDDFDIATIEAAVDISTRRV